MSNSNNFNQNLAQTNLDDAYKFQTFSEYIPQIMNSSVRFSPQCIFCSSNNSVSLMNDGGSFRQCMNCRKQFRANIIK
jgi:hypothetical protein